MIEKLPDPTEDDVTFKALIEKVKHKMEVAKFFSGFLSLLLGFSIKDLPAILKENPSTHFIIWLGVLSIFTSLVFAVFTLFAYDRLLMPKKFLDPRPLKTDSNENFKEHMVNAWQYLFLPSVTCLFLGIITLLFSNLKPRCLISSGEVIFIMTVITIFVIAFALFKRNPQCESPRTAMRDRDRYFIPLREDTLPIAIGHQHGRKPRLLAEAFGSFNYS